MSLLKCTDCGATDDAADLESESAGGFYCCNNCGKESMVLHEKPRKVSITTQVSPAMLVAIDKKAVEWESSRAQIIRQALNYGLLKLT